MPLPDFNPELSIEVRDAVNAAFDAMAECHKEMASSSEKVVSKIAQVARVLGWPDQIVSAIINQMESVTEIQIQMMDHIMKVWQEQIKLWPGLNSAGNWLDPNAFDAMSVNPAQSWTPMGEQWQKNWAQMMMSQWMELSKHNVPRKSDDRE